MKREPQIVSSRRPFGLDKPCDDFKLFFSFLLSLGVRDLFPLLFLFDLDVVESFGSVPTEAPGDELLEDSPR
jgi:hypothetical protein